MTERDDATLRQTNSNLEIPNPKQIRISKIPMTKTKIPKTPRIRGRAAAARLGHLSFVFRACFEFRASDFGFPRGGCRRIRLGGLESGGGM